jgi:fatty aldehyde-generating acyl-ACP reductase
MTDSLTPEAEETPVSCDFATIGHLESWQQIHRYFRAVNRGSEKPTKESEVEQVFSFVPPRRLFRLRARSVATGREVTGAYIETFIPPNELGMAFLRKNLRKVKQAVECVHRQGAKVASLGGFSSILIEGNIKNLIPDADRCAFTTGNTLTVAFIVRGLENACALRGTTLAKAKLLVIGATGDVGSGCVEALKDKVEEVLLCARDVRKLQQQEERLCQQGIRCRSTDDLASLLPLADVIISVASVPEPTFVLRGCKPEVIVCDAGYPKNVKLDGPDSAGFVFFGGMGLATGGYQAEPSFLHELFSFPDPRIANGCMIEAGLLALEGRYEGFSTGRGGITSEKVDEIWAMATKHGMEVAPLFNDQGLLGPSSYPASNSVHAA